jgi:hypothetical protein
MSNGIRSLPRYQEGGPLHPRRAGLGPVPVHPQETSWRAAFGISEHGGVPSLSAEELARRTPQQQVDYVLLREFERMGDLRQIIGGDASFAAEPSSVLDPSRSQTLRKEWLSRNPNAPGQGTISRGTGSYRSLFPRNESPYSIENILFEIMSPDITPEEIALALDDPMFGGAISGNATNAEINERVYGRRYANRRFGRTWKGTVPFARWDIARQVVEGARGPGVAAMPQTLEYTGLGESVRNLPGGSPDVDPPLRRGRIDRFRQGIGRFSQGIGDYFQMRNMGGVDPTSVPESSLLPPQSYLTDVDPPLRRGISGLRHRAGQAARGAGITALKAIRNRLPAIIAAGVGTVATSHPVSALADIALSPTELGSGDVPKEDPRSDEDKIKYYEDLMSLGRELGVGQHHPSILQLSREINEPSTRSSYPNGPSIRSSFPMRRMRR